MTEPSCRTCINTINQTEDLDGWKATCNLEYSHDYQTVVTEENICYCHDEREINVSQPGLNPGEGGEK